MANRRGVIFGFDGVLADSWQQHEQAWREALGEFHAGLPEGALARSIGMPVEEAAQVLIDELELSVKADQLADVKQRRFATMADDVAPMAGGEAAVRRIKEDFPVGLLSLLPRELFQRSLGRFGLTGVADVELAIEDAGEGEVLDGLLARAAAELELKPVQLVLVDDSRVGILAATRLSMNTIAFDSNPKHEVDYSMADAQIKTLDELVPELINAVAAS